MTDFKVRDNVRILDGIDEHFNKKFKGKIGKVVGFDNGLITVRVVVHIKGYFGKMLRDEAKDGFFPDELELIK